MTVVDGIHLGWFPFCFFVVLDARMGGVSPSVLDPLVVA